MEEEVHWNGNFFISMKYSSLAALEVVILTTAAKDENWIKMTTFSFHWIEGGVGDVGWVIYHFPTMGEGHPELYI